jgi:hypothetical protein
MGYGLDMERLREGAIVVLAVLLAACGDRESRARSRLQGRGFADIDLYGGDDRQYEFTATKDKQSCVGSIQVGVFAWKARFDCHPAIDDAGDDAWAHKLIEDGRALVNNGDPSGIKLFQEACNAGDPWGCHNAGVCYRDGKSLAEPQPKRAIPLLEKACDSKRLPLSCIYLGYAYKQGLGPRRMRRGRARIFKRPAMRSPLTVAWISPRRSSRTRAVPRTSNAAPTF